jgi:hypothetical protein
VDGSVHQEASRDGIVGFEGDATRELNASAFEGLPHDSVAPTVGGAELMGELKKMNKNLRRMIQLQKSFWISCWYTCFRILLLDGHLSLEMFVLCLLMSESMQFSVSSSQNMLDFIDHKTIMPLQISSTSAAQIHQIHLFSLADKKF